MRRRKLYILIGLPGTGKSTWAERMCAGKSMESMPIVICPDSIRKELTGSETDQSKNREVFELAFARLEEALKITHSDVIFDSTAYCKRNRKTIIEIGKRSSVEVVAVVFGNNTDLAFRGNSLRERQVPEHVIRSMASRWEDPIITEGFDAIQTAEWE